MIVKGDAGRLPFADGTFDLTVGSPPYLDARLYLEDGVDRGVARDCLAWVDWMLAITAEAMRVTKGPVIWVCSGTTRARNYQPGPEGLLWEWWKRGGECHCLRPVYWNRSGIPGSGGDQWYRSDVEYCLCFKRPGKLPYADPRANGHIPKMLPGGPMSHRDQSGVRVNSRETPEERDLWGEIFAELGPKTFPWGVTSSGNIGRNRQGEKLLGRPKTITRGHVGGVVKIANPGNWLRTHNGGNSLGHPLAHENEAPFNLAVPRFFINSHCPPGGRVLDPFLGSGTTLHAAAELGRKGVGVDLRQSQCALATRRLQSVTPGFSFSEE